MSLQIQMIGTGSAFAKNFYNNNALIHADGFTLLIDCGITAPRALYELGIPLDRIDAVLISHIHADHVGGLEELAFQYRYVFKRKIKLLVPAPLEAVLWEHTLRGGLENKAEGLVGLNDYFEVAALAERTPTSIHPKLTVELLPTDHIPGKASYSFLLNGKVFYSADMRFSKTLLTGLHEQGCEVILHDCQLFCPGTVHACLDELLTLPEEVQEKVLLMHYGDNMSEFIGKTGRMTFIEQFKTYPLPS
ncbi:MULTISPECIES: MBL fold metallo-hydrolase [Paenibacillus]|uniref:MBL fold metallo-hydrolase n=1 Tax=Paenibacillus naphthalenovorans TaxID=162209 RepID=A0A0U2U5G7_9BACL|nr:MULTISPECIES: MBL fold metallo-hydrolase [Paenibacillus]ALS21480.1 MBL fold metallo-hydrolase [Paenibacillus naphthalenovorans]NTZ18359.1 ribonuclease Z [Paenibacillus sp. JMULE4]GCL71208.1 ribonuclease Z [Paenibacillus naphthalenovorans]SDI77180.1 Ribonuclease BN, tRNA processing enzyme [Paenibacillus naphthalenovorans]